METLDYDYTIHQRENAGDETLLVKFYLDAVKDDKASLEQGRPIYKDVEHIDIRIPGNRDNIVIRPVRQGDAERFPRHYAAFKNRVGNAEVLVGTPLEAWPWPSMSKARVEEMRALNIRTVEQIVAAPDSLTSKIMGFQQMKTEAKTWLEATKSAAPILELTAKLQASNARIEALERQIALMVDGQEAAKASKKK